MDDRIAILPEPGMLRVGAGPFGHGMSGASPMTTVFMVAIGIIMAGGFVLFGWHLIRVSAISIATALLLQSFHNMLTGRGGRGGEGQSLMIGALFACTLPPLVSWQVVMAGSAIAILLAQILLGGAGNYFWHPVALARVLSQVLFHDQLSPERWAVLAPGRLFWGNLTFSTPLPPLWSWRAEPAQGTEGWLVARPLEQLQQVLTVGESSGHASMADALMGVIRDQLPPWQHTLTGTAGGALGEACTLAVLVAGGFLLWQGFLRARMLVVSIVWAAVLAAILPITVQGGSGATWAWGPGLAVYQQVPVGLIYVAYQLTSGDLLLVLLVLAAEPTTSPLTARGHRVFGVLIVSFTMVLRMMLGIPAAAFWGLLAANSCVPIINRLTRRRVLGV